MDLCQFLFNNHPKKLLLIMMILLILQMFLLQILWQWKTIVLIILFQVSRFQYLMRQLLLQLKIQLI